MTVDRRRHGYLPTPRLQRVAGGVAERGDSLSAARNPRRSIVSIICGTVTASGSNVTTASFALRLTLARVTPFSPSRAFFTPTGQAPQVIPSTPRTTVEVAAEICAKAIRPTITATIETHRFIASLPC